GIGCCLTNRLSGESIDVDFYECTSDYLSVEFYLKYLRSLRSPEPPEARLIALHSSIEPINLAIGELLTDKLLVPLKADARDRFRIVEDVLAHHNAIEVFCREWERSGKRLRLAAMIGDWLAAEDAACLSSDANLKRMVSERAAKCRARRYAELAL